jgi:predicted Rossmann fold nucleotide-binding protein DprA/Smf involved in DNA uptake
MEEIAPQLAVRGGKAASQSRLKLPANLTVEFQRIFNLFDERTLQIDEVIESSGYSPSRVSEILLELELHGYIRQLPGKKYTAER